MNSWRFYVLCYCGYFFLGVNVIARGTDDDELSDAAL